MENIKLELYNGVKEAIGGNYGFFSVGFDFGYNQQNKALTDEIWRLKRDYKALESINKQFVNNIEFKNNEIDKLKQTIQFYINESTK